MATKILIATIVGLAGLLSAAPADAQQMINEKARQKATFFNAPRQIQIIDERPVIHDFREAPQATPMIALPPGPSAGGGAYGAGAGGQMNTGGALPYRTPYDPQGALPKSGFGSFSNIPARGMAPQSALPKGTSTGVHTALPAASRSRPPQQARGSNPSAAPAITVYRPAAPASYNSNYTQYSGGTGSGSTTSSAVSGRLMNRLKGK